MHLRGACIPLTPIQRRWLPLNALRAFDAVGQRLSFTAGAQALNVAQSAVSRHVMSLEAILGQKLFDRSGGGLLLTPTGEILLPEVRRAFDRLERALATVTEQTAKSQPIRIHVPPTLLHQIVLPMLQDFHTEHPDIRIDVSSAHVTGLPPRATDMAIVFDRPNVDDQITDLLWTVRVAPVCSPQTALQYKGTSLEQFLSANSLLHVKLDNEPRGLLWDRFAQQCGLNVQSQRDMTFDTALLAVSYAMAAEGVALADIDMFGQELKAGRLVMPYDQVIEDGFSYYLKLRAEDLADPAIGLFRQWLIKRFANRERYAF